MCGYDINMLDKVRELVNFPLTILGEQDRLIIL